MRSKLKLSRSLEFISSFFKAQLVINTKEGANLALPPIQIELKAVKLCRVLVFSMSTCVTFEPLQFANQTDAISCETKFD